MICLTLSRLILYLLPISSIVKTGYNFRIFSSRCFLCSFWVGFSGILVIHTLPWFYQSHKVCQALSSSWCLVRLVLQSFVLGHRGALFWRQFLDFTLFVQSSHSFSPGHSTFTPRLHCRVLDFASLIFWERDFIFYFHFILIFFLPPPSPH